MMCKRRGILAAGSPALTLRIASANCSPRGILNAKAECTGLHGPAKVACPNVVRMGDWQPGHLLHRSRRETVETRHLDVQDCDVGTVRPSGRVVAGITCL